MKGKSVHETVLFFLRSPETGRKNLFRPIIVVMGRSAAYLLDVLLTAVITHESLISAVFISIIIRVHAAAAAPVFISQAEEINFPRIAVPVSLSELCHGRNSVKCHILYPFRHFSYRSASQVPVNISLASKLPAELKIFVGTETVILNHSSPVCINYLLPCTCRPYPVHPVILVCKTSAGPPEHGNPYLFQCFNHIGSHSVHIFNRRILPYINPFINASSKMFGKMPVYFSVDPAQFPVGIDHHSRHLNILLLHFHTV